MSRKERKRRLSAKFKKLVQYFEPAVSVDDQLMIDHANDFYLLYNNGYFAEPATYELYFAELVDNLDFIVEAIRLKGQAKRLLSPVEIKNRYKFIIDERIYYRRLICKPALGLSPPSFRG